MPCRIHAQSCTFPSIRNCQKEKQDSAHVQMDEQKRALHALNRLAFGPRPGDVIG